MTMGLDLKSLENLRIFNGYETEKKERRLSIEAPSSPDSNTESDTGHTEGRSERGKARGKSKCGRPANPIPRHKRDSHIKAEYKRRDKIQKGFDVLLSLVPELRGVSEKESKSKMLFKTADYCRRLKSECGSTQTELTALRQELENLGTEIQELQDQLPKHGIQKVVKNEEQQLDVLYNQYVQEETQKNWKFWIFGYFMRPLYDSFKQMTSCNQDRQEFNSSVFDWLQSSLSLANLRKGLLDALRKISKHTSIMTSPEQLPLESWSKVNDICVNVAKDSTAPLILTPPITPRALTPATSHVSSTTATPIQTPTPTPPRTPTVSRRSSKREIQRSTESRSRSNSPATEETKPKRRSSYRSRSGRRSEENMEKIDYVPIANPNASLLGQLLTTPLSAKTNVTTPIMTQTGFTTPPLAKSSMFGDSTTQTVSHNESKHTIPPKDTTCSKEASSLEKSMNTNDEEQLFLKSLLESLASTINSAVSVPVTTAQYSNVFISNCITSEPRECQRLGDTSNMFANCGAEPMKVTDTHSSAGFIPLSSSGIISNGSLILADDMSTGFNQMTNEVSGGVTSEVQPMELFPSITSSFTSTDFPSHSFAMPMQSVSGLSMQMPPSQPSIIPSPPLNHDEDSMMNQLGLDVMDINCVMNFFTDDKPPTS